MNTETPVRVILIEDERIMCEIIKPALSAVGCEVVGEADDGESGLALFEETAPDLVLLDIRMPGMDGLEALTAIKEKSAAAYVVMLTAVDDIEAVEDCMIAGAKDYLNKTMPVAEMINRLTRHVDRISRKA